MWANGLPRPPHSLRNEAKPRPNRPAIGVSIVIEMSWTEGVEEDQAKLRSYTVHTQEQEKAQAQGQGGRGVIFSPRTQSEGNPNTSGVRA